MHRPLTALLLAATVLLGGCANKELRSKATILDETLRTYAATIRWGNFDQATSFIEPKQLAEHPPSQLDMDRLHQVRVSSYNEQPAVPVGEDEVRQTVQIELVNVTTQTVRSIVDRPGWKYDEAGKHWWLTAGLPDISRHQ
jgi:hypothetical protein